MYVLVYKTVTQSKVTVNKSKTYFQTIVQLFLITLSNILCWFPTNVIYVAAMLMPTYPANIVLWTIITVLPINSIVNPLVFIVGTFRRRRIN